MPLVDVTIEKIKSGEVLAQVNDALLEIYNNILDPNTEAKKAREVTLKVKITPNEKRDTLAIASVVTKKLVSPRSVETVLFLGMEEEGPVAYEQLEIALPAPTPHEAPAPRERVIGG